MSQQPYRCLEQLWKPIVRPPRHIYKIEHLGPSGLQLNSIQVKRLDFEIKNSRKLTVYCSLWEPVHLAGSPHPCMIYLHGNSSSRVEALSIVEYLIPLNIAVCGIDLSGSGHSEGNYISLGYHESLDVQALFEHLRLTQVDSQPQITKIGIWGRSMGSVTGILAASKNQDLKVLVCDSPFSNLTVLCKDFAERQYRIPRCCFSCFWCLVKRKIRAEAKFDIDDLNILQVIQTLEPEVGIVFMIANKDVLIDIKHPRLLYERFRGEKKFKQFEGEHNSKRPPEVMRETAMWVKSRFGDAWHMRSQPQRPQYGRLVEEAVPMIHSTGDDA